ncbi:MAG: histidine--tRNA ligase [Caldisericaceae bacterium]
MEIKNVKGFKDILFEDALIFEHIQNIASSVAKSFGYKPIVLPTVEYAELFNRSVGDTTDIVEKEMFTFMDKGERLLSLRPEFTASVARSYIEHHMETKPKPLRLYYFGQCFRYENPQRGRYREFYQFGVEALGDISPTLDIEVIQIAIKLIESLNIKNLKIKINSIGCRTCRPIYKEALKNALIPHFEELCDNCKRRFDTNPLRILDCKEEKEELKNSLPTINDYLCEDCKLHFEEVKKGLKQLGIPFEIDNKLVRGLDYYSKTVFEVISEDLGSQNALLGGGRYDYLIEDLGGRKTPGVGFAMGIERLIEILKAQNYSIKEKESIYIAYDKQFLKEAYEVANILKDNGFIAYLDVKGDNIGNQIKRASKVGVSFTVIIGSEEISTKTIKVKNMQTSEQENFKKEHLIDFIRGKKYA